LIPRPAGQEGSRIKCGMTYSRHTLSFLRKPVDGPAHDGQESEASHQGRGSQPRMKREPILSFLRKQESGAGDRDAVHGHRAKKVCERSRIECGMTYSRHALSFLRKSRRTRMGRNLSQPIGRNSPVASPRTDPRFQIKFGMTGRGWPLVQIENGGLRESQRVSFLRKQESGAGEREAVHGRRAKRVCERSRIECGMTGTGR
jgi:hypothetical protein